MEWLKEPSACSIQILVKNGHKKWTTNTMEEEKFLTKARFTKLVESVVKEHKSSYMDAIIRVCEDVDLDLEDVKKYVAPIIKDKLEAEAMSLNFLPRQNALPFE
jgi:hypothetical protein